MVWRSRCDVRTPQRGVPTCYIGERLAIHNFCRAPIRRVRASSLNTPHLYQSPSKMLVAQDRLGSLSSAPLIDPIVDRPVPKLRVLGFQDPVTFVGEVQ